MIHFFFVIAYQYQKNILVVVVKITDRTLISKLLGENYVLIVLTFYLIKFWKNCLMFSIRNKIFIENDYALVVFYQTINNTK